MSITIVINCKYSIWLISRKKIQIYLQYYVYNDPTYNKLITSFNLNSLDQYKHNLINKLDIKNNVTKNLTIQLPKL